MWIIGLLAGLTAAAAAVVAQAVLAQPVVKLAVAEVIGVVKESPRAAQALIWSAR